MLQHVVVRLPTGLKTIQHEGVPAADHLLSEPDEFGVRGIPVFCLSKCCVRSLPGVEWCRRIRLCGALGWSHVGSPPSLYSRGIEARKGFLSGAHGNAIHDGFRRAIPHLGQRMAYRLPLGERRAS